MSEGKTTPRSEVRRSAVQDPVGTAHRIIDLEEQVELQRAARRLQQKSHDEELRRLLAERDHWKEAAWAADQAREELESQAEKLDEALTAAREYIETLEEWGVEGRHWRDKRELREVARNIKAGRTVRP